MSLALDVLGEANKQLRERFSPALNKAATEYLHHSPAVNTRV
jgi:hypothetical protein